MGASSPLQRVGRGLAAALAAFGLGALAACAEPPLSEQWELIPVIAAPVTLAPDQPSLTEVGELAFRGGLELTADKISRFGGLSGLHVSDAGALLAVSDQGAWFAAQLEFDAEGRLTGLVDARIAAMRDLAGAPIGGKQMGDAEDLTRLPDGRFAVSFEQRHRVWFYDIDAQGPFAAAQPGPALGGTDSLLSNEGLEGLAALPDGRLLGAAEFPPRGDDSPFWLLDQTAASAAPPQGGLALPKGFGLVGLTALPNGDVLALERFFLPFIGVRLNLRQIPASELRADVLRLEGRLIAALEPPVALDNFESVSATVRADGVVRIYILSDNNFSRNQRTLLYAFDWTPPTPVAALPAPAAPEADPAALEAAPEAVGGTGGPAGAAPPPAALAPAAEAKAAADAKTAAEGGVKLAAAAPAPRKPATAKPATAKPAAAKQTPAAQAAPPPAETPPPAPVTPPPSRPIGPEL